MEKEAHIFVYGTLRRQMSHPLSHLLVRHGVFVGTGIFQGKLYDLGRYPGAVPSKTKTDLITGEVYCLQQPDKVLELLDEYEGPRFKRSQVTIFYGEDRPISAWIYLYARSVAGRRIISSGDYVQYRNAS
jgi:gamma-glutamylcyclotransferase (GGCT)/AIG2-like uncharacterized protein YtfP